MIPTNTIAAAYHERTENLNALVQQFNDKIKNEVPDKPGSSQFHELVEQIHPLVEKELDRLRELRREIAARQEQLSRKTCCSIPIPVSRNIRNIVLLNSAVKISEIAGVIMALIAENNSHLKWAGVTLFSVSAMIDVIASAHESMLYLENGERAELAKLNLQGVEHAAQFELVLRKLKEIKNKEEAQKDSHDSRFQSSKDVNISDETDKKIGDCLNEYGELPKTYRDEDVYSRILSLLIQNLPTSDPLRKKLHELEPLDLDLSSENANNRTLRTSYFPSSPRRRSTSSLEQSHDRDWRSEELAGRENNGDGVVENTTHMFEMEKETEIYKKQFQEYQATIMNRFGLRRTIPYIETPNGWKITPYARVEKIYNPAQRDHLRNANQEEAHTTQHNNSIEMV